MRHRYTPESLERLRSLYDQQLMWAAAVLLGNATKDLRKVQVAVDSALEIRDCLLETLDIEDGEASEK